jgi:hypothetical protein
MTFDVAIVNAPSALSRSRQAIALYLPVRRSRIPTLMIVFADQDFSITSATNIIHLIWNPLPPPTCPTKSQNMS